MLLWMKEVAWTLYPQLLIQPHRCSRCLDTINWQTNQIQDQMCSRYRKQNDDLKIDMNIYKMEDKLWCRYRRYHTQLDIEKFEKRVKVLTEVCYVKNILVNYHKGRDNDDFCFVNYWQEWNNTESVTLNTKVVQRI